MLCTYWVVALLRKECKCCKGALVSLGVPRHGTNVSRGAGAPSATHKIAKRPSKFDRRKPTQAFGKPTIRPRNANLVKHLHHNMRRRGGIDPVQETVDNLAPGGPRSA